VLLRPCAAAVGVGLHVDTTAHFSSCFYFHSQKSLWFGSQQTRILLL